MKKCDCKNVHPNRTSSNTWFVPPTRRRAQHSVPVGSGVGRDLDGSVIGEEEGQQWHAGRRWGSGGMLGGGGAAVACYDCNCPHWG